MNKLTIVLLAGILAIPAVFAKDPAVPEKKVANHLDPYFNGTEAEGRLAGQVRHELVMLPYFGVFDDLGFTINGTEITLVGEVTRPSLKSDAANVVRRIEGVTKVTNEIEVLPLSPNDDRVRRSAFRAIYGDRALSVRYGYRAMPSIHIIVKNGNIRLEGVVANMMDKNIAGIRANGVHGAFSVVNELRVEGR